MRFITGDSNGLLKSVRVHAAEGDTGDTGDTEITASLLTSDGVEAQRKITQLQYTPATRKLLAARSDGALQQYTLSGNGGALALDAEWTDSRSAERSIGVGVGSAGGTQVNMSVTSSGHLCYTSPPAHSPRFFSLPPRLTCMRTSPSGRYMAVGGVEQEPSVWDVQRVCEMSEDHPTAYAPRIPQGKTKLERRKEKLALHDGELWRARNVPNDNLNLRSPVHVTALEWLDDNTLLTGSASGSVRLYSWREQSEQGEHTGTKGKVGTKSNNSNRPLRSTDTLTASPIRCLARGAHGNVFVADSNCALMNVDTASMHLRNAYRGLGAAVGCVATTSNPLISLSGAIDGFVRVHSTVTPGTHSKAAILASAFVKSTPMAIVWDGEEQGQEVKEKEHVRETKSGKHSKDGKKRADRDDQESDSEGELDDVLRDMETVTGEDMKVKRKAEGRRTKKKRV
ncbi:hypothetical protein E3P86_02148 [Wallemia ichthyophaga]|uniref:Ribosome biogenesis protein NSA1 n=1 Tax=Wallemia ichthyophaga TaxID=245174 RepID=A0A4T0J4E8_WALIC|nr:hypothetical protein E3P86_02148 [Wallemia ichthyophaga]